MSKLSRKYDGKEVELCLKDTLIAHGYLKTLRYEENIALVTDFSLSLHPYLEKELVLHIQTNPKESFICHIASLGIKNCVILTDVKQLPPAIDKRQFRRETCSIIGTFDGIPILVKDISYGGCRVISAKALSSGNIGIIDIFGLAPMVLEAKAQVVRTESEQYGLRFIDITYTQKKQLQTIIEEVLKRKEDRIEIPEEYSDSISE